jgi:SNF2 family DNA or RNA helicase
MSFKGRLIVPYQREGVAWLLERELAQKGPKGGFLCDEMGLGKTIQLIATMIANAKTRTLIVVPKSIVNQWKEEVAKFAPGLLVGVFDGADRTKNHEDLLPFHIVIAPYTVIMNKGKKEDQGYTVLHRIQWSRVILDEAHEIRTFRSKRHKAAALFKTDIRWVVSGTPVYNSMKDFVSLCLFLGLSKSHVQAKTKEIRETYVLRRTKEDVARFNRRLELPPCDFQNVEIEMYPEEKNLYESVFESNKDRISRLVKYSTNIGMHQMDILECLLRIRQVMVHPQLYLSGIAAKNGHEPEMWEHGSKKLDTLTNLVKEHPTEKSLIFCQFIQEMNMIEERLEGPVFRIDGSVDKDERVRQIEGFKKTVGGASFVIQIKAGGQGLNLQEATRVYITAPSWNPATELQAIARSHRTGQTQKVYVKKLVCSGDDDTCPSVEETIMNLQGHKSIICAEVLNDPRLVQQIPTRSRSTMTLADILNIFKV